MKVNNWHSWQVSTSEASDIQLKMADKVSRINTVKTPCFIAGVDISVTRSESMATAAIVVLNYPELKPVETRIINDRINFPYVPGFLSFREAPLILTACEQLDITLFERHVIRGNFQPLGQQVHLLTGLAFLIHKFDQQRSGLQVPGV